MIRRTILACAFVAAAFSPAANAWENHAEITYFSLQAYDGWEDARFEPVEAVLSSLRIKNDQAPQSLKELCDFLQIHCDKVNWKWEPAVQVTGPFRGSSAPNMLDVLEYSSFEADSGMDQNLEIHADQKYMGGTTGLGSQAIRHMFYRAFDIFEPIATFHFPLHEMGFAPERAEIYFKLAVQAQKAGHSFWAHRFLGLGLHYVQDIGQPYHANQFASFSLLPLKILISEGWDPFVVEATRVVANFHLAFERHIDALIEPLNDSGLVLAFKVPDADPRLKAWLEQGEVISIQDGVRKLANASSALASEIATTEQEFMGATLRNPSLNLMDGFFDNTGRAKIDFKKLEDNPQTKKEQKAYSKAAFKALSHTGIATRWYYDRFRKPPANH